ncbi:MAG: FAD-dependent oxidoreductase [Micrococcales bacterium]
MKVVIIGGVAGGMSAATRLRRLDESAQITVYEMGEHVSYANCGLPYFVSDVISQRQSLLLQTPESLWARFRIKVKVNTMVTAIHPETKTVTVKNLQTGAEHIDDYDKLVISTGAKPKRLDIPGIDRALTLRNVTDADQVKAAIAEDSTASVAVIGAGFIGIELAENLRHLGVEVSLIQRGPTVLGQFDPEMVQPLQQRLMDHGVKLYLNAVPTQITADQILLQDGRSVAAKIAFSAAGVEPDNWLAKEAGLRIGATGGLWVDQQQRTSDPHIYAAGDAVEKHGELTGNSTLIPLANLANRHGRLVADAIAGKSAQAHAALGTVIIGAFGLAAGITGLSERAAAKEGIPAQVIHLHPGSHAGYYPGAKRVSLKVLFDPSTGRLLGAQATGEDGVDKRIDVIATAIHGGLTIDDLMDLELAYAPQFGSAKDPINLAGYVGNNVLSGVTPTLQWHELSRELANGATLIDVRTHGEHGQGAIPGAINIPVDDLRDRLAEIPRQNVIVSCQVGQRGHIATQILKAHGVQVRNLDGGYLTWKAGTAA